MTGARSRPQDAETAWRLLTVAEELAQLGTWDLDLATGRMTWSEGLFRILDVEPDEEARTADAVLAFIHPADRPALAALMTSMREDPDVQATGVLTHEYRVVRSDGSVAEVQARGRVVLDEQGEAVRWVGSIQDITGRRRGERVIRARTEVTHALRDWASSGESLVELLRRTARALAFPVASLWLADGGTVRCRAAWHAPESELGEFVATERTMSFRAGEGPAGRAFAERATVVLGDLAQAPPFTGRDTALEAGVRCVVAVPIRPDGEAIGVVTLCDTVPRHPDDAAVDALDAAGREIGTFLERRRASLGASPLTRRELEVLRLATEGLSGPDIARRFVVSPSTVKTHFENIYEKLGVSDRASAVAYALRTGLLD